MRRQKPTSQEKKPQNETYLASTLILDFAASRAARHTLLVYAAQAAVFCYGSLGSPRCQGSAATTLQ